MDADLDSMWVFDHLWPLSGGKERPVFEGWTSLAWAAAASEHIEVGTLVTRSSLRRPALLGKMAATVATFAPGRTVIAIGSGDKLSKPENDAFGIPYHGGGARVAQLASTVRVVKSFVTTSGVTLHDDYVSIEALPTSPRPAQPPRIWIGGRDEDLLRLAGEVADGWNGWGGTPERFAQDAGVVADAAGDRAIELSWGGQAILGPTDRAAAERLGDRNPKAFLVGAPATVADRLAAFVEAGVRHVVFALPNASEPEAYELVAEVRASLRGTG